jgi:ribokinase
MSLLVAGSLHWDVIVTAPYLPRADETVAGSEVRYAFGGKGGNQAVAAARMGAQVAMAGAVGQDAFADLLVAGLQDAGVAVDQVARKPGPSGISVAIQDLSGDYGAVIVSGANLLLDAATVSIPNSTTWVLLQNEVPGSANLALAREARAYGAKVVLTAAPVRPADLTLLALTDILIVNRVEAEGMLGAPLAPELAVRQLSALGPPRVILTRGGEGVTVWDGQVKTWPAHQVSVISTHGAGDAFTGALAAALDAGLGFSDAVRLGQAAGALTVSTPPGDHICISAAAAFALAGLAKS